MAFRYLTAEDRWEVAGELRQARKNHDLVALGDGVDASSKAEVYFEID